MNITQLLSPDTTLVCDKVSSKKKVLETISELIAATSDTSSKRVFESLCSREKLGSTGLGDGVALPHGRVSQCHQVKAVFLLLDKPIDYDAPDGKAVDIVFALIAPEQAHQEHLGHLAQIAQILSNQKTLSQIRLAHSNEALFEILQNSASKLT